MIPETIFTKMNSLGLTSEQSIGVSQLLFQSVEVMTGKIEATIDKMMDRMEATVGKMNETFGQQILAAVKETEEKIFARIAEEEKQVEEKKRVRREAIAARKAAKALEAANQKEGVAVEPDARFQEDGASSKRNGESDVRETDASANHAVEKPANMNDDTDKPPVGSSLYASEEELEALQRENERIAGVKEGDIWKDGSKVIYVGTGGYVRSERDEYIDLAKYDAFMSKVIEFKDELMIEHICPDTGEFYNPKMNEGLIDDMAEKKAHEASKNAEFQAALRWDEEHGIENHGNPMPPTCGWQVEIDAFNAAVAEEAMR